MPCHRGSRDGGADGAAAVSVVSLRPGTSRASRTSRRGWTSAGCRIKEQARENTQDRTDHRHGPRPRDSSRLRLQRGDRPLRDRQREQPRGRARTITVGSADFPESVLLAEIYAGALKAKGVDVAKKLQIGSREAYIPALQDGSIDLIPEYTGVLAQYFNKEAKATDPEGVYTELRPPCPTP